MDSEIKLVVLDLDGTILDLYQPAPVSPRVVRAIAATQARGIPVTIGTGRTLEYVRDYVAPLNITTPVLTTQGAIVGDPISGAILYAAHMPLSVARKAAAWVDGHPNVAAFYFSDKEGHTQIFQNRLGDEAEFYDHVFGNPRQIEASMAALLRSDEASPPIKFIVIEESDASDEAADLTQTLGQLFGVDLYITRTHPRLVEGTATGVNKGTGLLRLCELIGVDPAHVLVIGDSDNDIPMLERAGIAIAMGNASAGVKAVAEWVAPAIDNDGAAVALERYLLDGLPS